jgi:hypothetical protein
MDDVHPTAFIQILTSAARDGKAKLVFAMRE